jgi:hypothetical protein
LPVALLPLAVFGGFPTMARVSSYDAGELERQIGPRGSSLVNSGNRALVQNWLVAQGLGSARVKAMKISTLYKCYNKPAYLAAVLAHNDGLIGADDAKDGEESAAVADLTIKSQAAVARASDTGADLFDHLRNLGDAIKGIAGETLNESRVIELIREHAPKPETAITEIVVINGETRVNVGAQHRQFDLLLQTAAIKVNGQHLNIWLSGPAGSGKTTAAETVAKALGLRFCFNGAIDTEYKLLGFTDAQGRIVSRPFREVYESGGVYLFDEIDRSLPGALLAFNAALANGYCDFPDGAIMRHPDCVIIAAANTYGLGGNADYVGAMKQDGAFLDRFVAIDWEIDEELERQICPDRAWCERVQRVRQRAKEKGLRVIVSPRASIHGAALLAAGIARDQVEKMTLRKGMSSDQWGALQ